ncbi:peptidoglycan D,D-transpeptidase FtsI family protein [Moraxella pluranimalium]|uniref:peptidoglycan D,D-transpeptidase FtsI family protein n=1 Tax=Moraxella pluranimalium TaxID=470453 RepID=UPI000991CCD0|nr:penicillin-binding protein 2 [Moraxella pluranimalium]
MSQDNKSQKTAPKSATITPPLRRKRVSAKREKSAQSSNKLVQGAKWLLAKIIAPKRQSATLMGGTQDVWRYHVIWFLIVLGAIYLAGSAVYRQVFDAQYLVEWGNEKTTRTRALTSTRGLIFDRNNKPLAANAPLYTISLDPVAYAERYYDLNKTLQTSKSDAVKERATKALEEMDLVKIAAVANFPLAKLQEAVALNHKLNYQADDIDDQIKQALPKGAGSRRLVLLNKVAPEIAAPLQALNIKNILNTERFDQRYYLQAEPNAQILGFMGRSQEDDSVVGRAGLEAQFNQYLTGSPGELIVLHDRYNMPINELSESKPQVKSQDLHLTIDSRLQYVLYKELEQVGRLQSARSSSGMVVDVKTGEVLAMGSWPSFNSNKLSDRDGANERNRPVMDVFEPGSVVKPFTVAAALESGKFSTNTIIDTNPGNLSVGGYTIRDGKNFGAITLARLIQRSSTVASAKIALALPNDAIVSMQQKFGLGQKTALNFPSEASGTLKVPSANELSRRATLSYGYGLEVTLAQLVQAYATLANNGVKQPLNLVKDIEKAKPERVISAAHAQEIVKMMELVTASGGTGAQAAINGYRVAGKTGTSRRANPKGGYYTDQHRAVFIGMAPASNPRFVVAILVEDPRKQSYAGQVSAPVFHNVMKEALRLYNVAYDKPLYAEAPKAQATAQDTPPTKKQP